MHSLYRSNLLPLANMMVHRVLTVLLTCVANHKGMYLGTIYISYMKLVQSNVEDLSVGQHRITRYTISIYSGNNVFGYLSLLTRGTITVIKQQQNPYISKCLFSREQFVFSYKHASPCSINCASICITLVS